MPLTLVVPLVLSALAGDPQRLPAAGVAAPVSPPTLVSGVRAALVMDSGWTLEPLVRDGRLVGLLATLRAEDVIGDNAQFVWFRRDAAGGRARQAWRTGVAHDEVLGMINLLDGARAQGVGTPAGDDAEAQAAELLSVVPPVDVRGALLADSPLVSVAAALDGVFGDVLAATGLGAVQPFVGSSLETLPDECELALAVGGDEQLERLAARFSESLGLSGADANGGAAMLFGCCLPGWYSTTTCGAWACTGAGVVTSGGFCLYSGCTRTCFPSSVCVTLFCNSCGVWTGAPFITPPQNQTAALRADGTCPPNP